MKYTAIGWALGLITALLVDVVLVLIIPHMDAGLAACVGVVNGFVFSALGMVIGSKFD